MIDVDRPRLATLAALLALTSLSPRAHAEPTADEKAQAEVLFQDGKKLISQKRYDEACPKLEESQRLDPAGGTLLNLAVCHELQGKTATAWVELDDALTQAKAEHRADRIQLAKSHIDRLEPKLSRLTVTVPPNARIAQLSITRDENPIHEAAFGTAIPVDPGDHKLVATAPGHLRWETEVELSPGEKREVVVPLLSVDPASLTGASASAGHPEAPPPEGSSSSPRKTLAYVALGGSAVALIVGSYFGFQTIAKHGTSDDHCPTSTTCDAQGVSANDDAHRDAWISDVGFGVALLAAGAGTYLLLSSDDASSASSRVHLAPSFAKTSGGLSIGGAF